MINSINLLLQNMIRIKISCGHVNSYNRSHTIIISMMNTNNLKKEITITPRSYKYEMLDQKNTYLISLFIRNPRKNKPG